MKRTLGTLAWAGLFAFAMLGGGLLTLWQAPRPKAEADDGFRAGEPVVVVEDGKTHVYLLWQEPEDWTNMDYVPAGTRAVYLDTARKNGVVMHRINVEAGRFAGVNGWVEAHEIIRPPAP